MVSSPLTLPLPELQVLHALRSCLLEVGTHALFAGTCSVFELPRHFPHALPRFQESVQGNQRQC